MNIEQKREYAKKYYLIHKEKIIQRSKDRYEKKTDQIKQYERQYYHSNSEKISQARREEYKTNQVLRTKILQDCKEYRETHKEQEYLTGKAYRSERVGWLRKYKQEKGCFICQSKVNLHFHHIDPSTKEFKVMDAKKSYETIMKEMKKCVILCNKCHHAIHDSIRYHKPFPIWYNKILELKVFLDNSNKIVI